MCISLPDLKLPGDKSTWHNEDTVLFLHSCSLIISEFERHKYAMQFFFPVIFISQGTIRKDTLGEVF